MSNFFNSIWSFLNAPLIVGFIAFVIYKWQKWDRKKDAAKVIILEIRQAEKMLDIIKLNFQISIDKPFVEEILYSNAWQENKHLFITNLDLDEMNSIDTFYHNCILISKTLELLNAAPQITRKNEEVQACMVRCAFENSNDYEANKKTALALINSENSINASVAYISSLQNFINKTSSISTTTGVKKLKEISERF